MKAKVGNYTNYIFFADQYICTEKPVFVSISFIKNCGFCGFRIFVIFNSLDSYVYNKVRNQNKIDKC